MNRLPSDLAVRVEGLGKRYRIGAKRDEHSRSIAKSFLSPLANFRARRALVHFDEREEDDVVWALRDCSFDVRPGEVLGIVGRNGAGKSTLLKILSRITEPTTGEAQLRGRVATLLEVGTGFHPDLSGRDNVFLNGAMLGMSRREIAARFDEIVAFSEVEKFIDTPVKRYSSGMYVRLAFAVAAHLEPDVLIADEVLAVGDAEFQRKCLGKMRDVASGGRTVLFVSHNKAAVAALCTRAIWLDGGRTQGDGGVDEILSRYFESFAGVAGEQDLSVRGDRTGDGTLRVNRISFRDVSGDPRQVLTAGDDAEIVLEYDSPSSQPLRDVSVALFIDSELGGRVATVVNTIAGDELRAVPPRGSFVCRIGELPLNEGNYSLMYKVRVGGGVADQVADAATFSVSAIDYYPTRLHPEPGSGALLLRNEWRVGEGVRAR